MTRDRWILVALCVALQSVSFAVHGMWWGVVLGAFMLAVGALHWWIVRGRRIPSDVPRSGTLRIQREDGTEDLVEYHARAGNTFETGDVVTGATTGAHGTVTDEERPARAWRRKS